MAAYGALVSVMQIIDQLHRHPHPPISLHKQHVESLTANVGFLQEFLEGYNPYVSYTSEADPLESRIAEAAYAAEDVIENYIVDQIHARITDDDGGKISPAEFYQGLEKVIDEMEVIKMEIIAKKMKMEGVQIIKKHSTTDDAAASFQSGSSTAHKVTTMVGLDEVLYQMLDKITGGARVRQIIPIVGMGGLGKTTLARNIYAHQLVKEHFDICAWSTISQVHNAPKILREILGQVGLDSMGDLNEYELGEKLYKYLMGRRYLIVMDDMWNIEAWDRVRSFFPDNGNGSRVVVTTRLSNLASKLNHSDGLDMKLLDKATSWNLFCKTVFCDEICPIELEDVGKKIVEGCRGLPLSIVVVGGLLSKSEATRENWEVTEENLSSVVNAEEEGSCLQILYTSYNNLPIHLKPCFLYMGGAFYEDVEFPVLVLIRLWVAEGFIKPIEGKSLEEAAEEYFEEVSGRNLVLIEARDFNGKPKSFKVHDLLRDLCLREARKEKFFYLLIQSTEICQGIISGQRRITSWLYDEEIASSTYLLEYVEAATVRSLIGIFGAPILSISRYRLLRICFMFPNVEGTTFANDEYYDYEEILIWLLNLRLLIVDADEHPLPKIPSHLWNLQTLLLLNMDVDEDCVLEIWNMPLLRQVFTRQALCLSDPPPDDDQVIVLENLHTLFPVRNLKLSEEVLKRIPNIRILSLYYKKEEEEEGDYYSFKNLHRLNKLQDLRLERYGWDTPSVRELTLPNSLKKLVLDYTALPWEEMASKIGCLPLLQVLKIKRFAFVGSEWETVEGQFPSLKYLLVHHCNDLQYWITDNAHFPRLERLVLRGLSNLTEIPSSIGDIPTLRSIELKDCSDSAVESVTRIVEEQQEMGNQDIQLQVTKSIRS